MQNCTRVYIRPFLCTESTSLTNQMNLKASKLNDEKCPGNTKSYKIGNSSDSQFEVSLANMIGEFLKLRLIQNDLSNCQSSVALRSTAMALLSRHRTTSNVSPDTAAPAPPASLLCSCISIGSTRECQSVTSRRALSSGCCRL